MNTNAIRSSLPPLTRIAAGNSKDSVNSPMARASVLAVPRTFSGVHFRTSQGDDARDMVEKFHYSGRVPSNVQFIGSLHRDGGLLGDAGELIAAAFFSIPPAPWREPILELSRLVRGDEPTLLSRLVSLSCKALKAAGHDLLVSYADVRQGHYGGIYQACSWKYHGLRKPQSDGVLINGKFIPGRTLHHLYGTRSIKKLSERGITAILQVDEGKHLYWRALGAKGRDKSERLGLRSMPYPKADGHE